MNFADCIFCNGRILTVDAALSEAQAVAIGRYDRFRAKDLSVLSERALEAGT